MTTAPVLTTPDRDTRPCVVCGLPIDWEGNRADSWTHFAAATILPSGELRWAHKLCSLDKPREMAQSIARDGQLVCVVCGLERIWHGLRPQEPGETTGFYATNADGSTHCFEAVS